MGKVWEHIGGMENNLHGVELGCWIQTLCRVPKKISHGHGQESNPKEKPDSLLDRYVFLKKGSEKLLKEVDKLMAAKELFINQSSDSDNF